MKKALLTAVMSIALLTTSQSIFAASTDFTYKGATKNGLYEGEGELFYKNHLLYKGTFSKGLYEGQGTLYYPDRTDGVTRDIGNTDFINKIQYVGQFKEGTFYGQGTLYYEVYFPAANHPNYKGVHYQGKFRYDKFSGYGVEYDVEGNVKHRGYFLDGEPMNYEGPKDERGLMNGRGILKNEEGTILFKGMFKHGEIEGEGTLYDPSKLWRYEGHFKDDEFHGTGKIYHINKLYFDGSFSNGKKEGQGKLFNEKGEVLYQGLFKNDKPVSIPFNVHAEVKVEKDLSTRYTISVRLNNSVKTAATVKQFNEMKKKLSELYGTPKDISNKDSQGFTVTTTIKDIEKGFTDPFSGVNINFIKTKKLFYNQYDSYIKPINTYDPNIVNFSISYAVSRDLKDVKSNTKMEKQMRFDVLSWNQEDGQQMINVQFQAFNLLNTIVFFLFIVVLIGGCIYFKKTSKTRTKKVRR